MPIRSNKRNKGERLFSTLFYGNVINVLNTLHDTAQLKSDRFGSIRFETSQVDYVTFNGFQ